MNQKIEFKSCLIVIILCMGILIPFNSLVFGINLSKEFTDSSQILNEETQSHQISNEMAVSEATTMDFSWSSWFDVYDKDSDGWNDTIDIIYEFADFTESDYFFLEFRIEVYIWDDTYNDWISVTDFWRYFEEEVMPGEVYTWSFTWSAWWDGDYRFEIEEYYDQIIDEWFEWQDARALSFIDTWTSWVVELDEDADGCFDTIEIWFSIKFTFTDWVHLRSEIGVEYWNSEYGYWENLDTVQHYFDEEVTSGELYEWSMRFSAWYSGTYNLSIHIRDSQTYRPLIEEKITWNDACAFSYFYAVDRETIYRDDDSDGCYDSIEIEYSFNFSFSDWIYLNIRVDIFYWNGYWEYFDNDWREFGEEVVEGDLYTWSYIWYAQYNGDYNFSISIQDGYTDRPLINEWVTWENACVLMVMDSWDSWYNEFDDDNDGCDDTIEIGFDFKFSYTGWVNLRIRVEIEYWNPDYEEWDWIDDHYDYLEEDVTAGDELTWSFRWQARFSGNYEFFVRIDENNFNLPLVEDMIQWDACAFNPITEWESWYNEYDKDNDGCDDTIEIGFDMLFSTTGSMTLYLRAEISYWDENSQQWNDIDYYYDSFEGNLRTNEWYYCSFEWSARYDGDYEIIIRVNGETGGTFFEESIQWENACTFEILDQWESSYNEYDEDNDGCADTIEIVYDVKFTFTGSVDLSLTAEIEYWNEESEYWEYVSYASHRFQEEVTAGDWTTFSFRWSATDDGDFEFDIYIRDSITNLHLIDEKITWNDACKYQLINEWVFWQNEYDEDNDGLSDTIEAGFDMTFVKSGPVFLITIIRVQYWNEELQYWQQLETYNMYEFFSDNVIEGNWYTISFTWPAWYSGDYNITLGLADVSGSATNTQIEESFEWTDATTYQGLELEWEPIHENYYEERPDSIDLGFEFLFGHSGSVDLDIRIQILDIDQAAMTFDLRATYWYSFTQEVTEGDWYEWMVTWDIEEDQMVYFFITVFDGRARLIDDMAVVYLYDYEEHHKLLPLEPYSSMTEITTTTMEEESSSTETPAPSITPGWSAALALIMFAAILSIRRVRRRIG